METENGGVIQHRPRAMFAVCYVALCKADRSFTTTYEQRKAHLIPLADNLLLFHYVKYNRCRPHLSPFRHVLYYFGLPG